MSAKFDFNGKVVLVTGSSSGIGAATALMFAQSGAEVVVTGLPGDPGLSLTADRCRTAGAKVLEMGADLSDEGAARALVENTLDTFGRVDILVNCAGMVTRAGIMDKSYMEAYRQVMHVNVDSLIFMTHICAEHLAKTRGVIINISSIRSTQSGVNDSPYCMSKTAVDMFTKCMAAELGPKGIRVNCVNPGAINTNFLRSLGGDPAKITQGMATILPARKGGEPEDIAAAILFLATNDAAFITGSSLVADGGHIAAGLGYHYDKVKK